MIGLDKYKFASMATNQAGKKEVDARSDVGNNSDMNLYDSTLSEPPDLSNWFSSYVYESPMLDTSDFEFCDFRETECIKESKIKLLSDGLEFADEPPFSQAALSEPHDVVDDSDTDDEAYSCSIFRKPAEHPTHSTFFQSRTTATKDETELTSLRNRVEYLEDEVKKLHELINRFISSNGFKVY